MISIERGVIFQSAMEPKQALALRAAQRQDEETSPGPPLRHCSVSLSNPELVAAARRARMHTNKHLHRRKRRGL